MGLQVLRRLALLPLRSEPLHRAAAVRVARLLAELPRIRATFERGELCYSQVRALTRMATRETEQNLLELARYVTAGQLEVVVRAATGES